MVYYPHWKQDFPLWDMIYLTEQLHFTFYYRHRNEINVLNLSDSMREREKFKLTWFNNINSNLIQTQDFFFFN